LSWRYFIIGDLVPGLHLREGTHAGPELRTMELNRAFWQTRYENAETGWDLGGPSTPLKAYLDQLTNKELRILIPGAGRAYEAEYAHRLGFTHVFVIDLTDTPYADLLARCPEFPKEHLLVGDLFAHEGQYDRILEQTFFCALDPTLRVKYVANMKELLKPDGKLVGVLFNDPLNTDRPPFGGSKEQYMPLFEAHFPEVTMEGCNNSIAPRAGRELWLCAPNTGYTPIDCSLYDTYEAAATRKTIVQLHLLDETVMQGTIKDLYVRDKVEWMLLDTGAEIRLDRIREMGVS